MEPSEVIFEVRESPEGGFEAQALGYSIFTEGDTMDELREMVKDAVTTHFEDGQGPRIVRLHVVRDEVLAL